MSIANLCRSVLRLYGFGSGGASHRRAAVQIGFRPTSLTRSRRLA